MASAMARGAAKRPSSTSTSAKRHCNTSSMTKEGCTTKTRANELYTTSPRLRTISTRSSSNASLPPEPNFTLIGDGANASKGSVDETEPEFEIHSEDQMKSTMHHVAKAARRIEGLNIKRYSFHRNELEVIATVDEGLAHGELEKRLQRAAGEVRVKLTCGDFPQFKFMSRQLGPGDLVTAVNEQAHIIGYVSNNKTDVYALTVGHVFTGTKEYTRKCYISTKDKITIGGTVRLSDVKMKYMVGEGDGPINDLALIKIDNPVNADNTWIIDDHPRCIKIHRGIAYLTGQRVRLLPTTLNNINIARVTSQEYAEDEQTFLHYTLESEDGGPVAIPGDSGTLVCSMPQPDEDSVLAYAYIFAGNEQNSWALPIEAQLKDLLVGSPLDYAGFDFVKKVETRADVTV